MITRLASDITVGDRVIEEDSGKVHKVTRILPRGYYYNSVIIQWVGGEACVLRDVELILAEPTQPTEAE